MQIVQPEWHLSWGIRLGEVILPQLSVWGLGNDGDDEEEKEQQGATLEVCSVCLPAWEGHLLGIN
jgi:hypothetical protein